MIINFLRGLETSTSACSNGSATCIRLEAWQLVTPTTSAAYQRFFFFVSYDQQTGFDDDHQQQPKRRGDGEARYRMRWSSKYQRRCERSRDKPAKCVVSRARDQITTQERRVPTRRDRGRQQAAGGGARGTRGPLLGLSS